MQHLLLAVFEHRSDARAAMDELLAAGFERSDLRLSEGDPASDVNAELGGGGIGAFFKAIFGVDRSQAAQMYADAVTRGHVVLTLCSGDLAALERAADIVDNYGAVDIEEKQEEWRSSTLQRGGPGLQQQAAPGASQYALPTAGAATAQPATAVHDRGRRSKRGGARLYQQPEPIAAGRRAVDQHLTMQQPAAPEPGREEFEHLAADDDVYFRHHWIATYADQGEDYSLYAPAYRYGHHMGSSEHFRDRNWEQAETDLRQDWQATRPASAWDKVKAAVRHGWERIRS